MSAAKPFGTEPMWEYAAALFDYRYRTYVRDLRLENKQLKAKLADKEKIVSIEFNKEENHIPWEPQLITGGGDGGDNVEPLNWLKDLPVGTYFLARERKTDPRNPMVSEFKIEWHADKCSKLMQSTGSGDMMELTVDTVRFSRHMEKVEIL